MGVPAPIHYQITAHTDAGEFSTIRRVEYERGFYGYEFNPYFESEAFGEALIVGSTWGREYFGLFEDASRLAHLVKDLPQGERVVVAPDNWPRFVTFDKRGEPMSARLVSPTDVGVKRVTVEMVDGPATRTIETHLGAAFFASWSEKSGEVRDQMRAEHRQSGASYYDPAREPFAITIGKGQFSRPKLGFFEQTEANIARYKSKKQEERERLEEARERAREHAREYERRQAAAAS